MTLFVIKKNTPAKANCLSHIVHLPDTKAWDVKIEEHKSSRSIQQNKMYWSWLKIIGDEVGMDKDEMHRMFAIRLLGPELFYVDGKPYEGAKSTTKLSTKEFGEYLDQIHATAMGMGLTLPTPEYFGMEKA